MMVVRSLCYGEMGRVINIQHQADLGSMLEKNVVLELDALTSTDKAFFIEALLLWIHHYRLADGKREQFKHAIIIEEAHHILLRQERSSGKEGVTDLLLREIRELGESIILIDQMPSLMAPTALANTHTSIFMNMKSRADVSTAASALLLDRGQEKCLGRLAVGHAIVKMKEDGSSPFWCASH